MQKQAGRVSIGTIVLCCTVVVLFIGVGPTISFLQGYGWLRKTSAEDIERELRRMSSSESFNCKEGGDGWDAICDVVSTRGGRQTRFKYGVVSSAVSPVSSISILPLDQPTPSRDEYVKGRQ